LKDDKNIVLVITGDIDKILPLKSIGRERVKVIGVHCAGPAEFWVTESKRYQGEERPVVILIDNSRFEPKLLANCLTEIIDKLQSWHPDIPILQLEYRF